MISFKKSAISSRNCASQNVHATACLFSQIQIYDFPNFPSVFADTYFDSLIIFALFFYSLFLQELSI